MAHEKSTSVGDLKMEDIDPGLLRQRRNLLIVSITIIIFELGGGVTIDSVSGLLGAFKLNNSDILLYVVWLALPYSMWRYWLYREPGLLEFNAEFIRTVNSMPSFIRLVEKTKSKITEKEINLENKHPVIIRGIFKRHLDFTTAVYTHEKVASNKRKYEKHTFSNSVFVNVPYLKIFWFEIKADILMLMKSRQYSDYIFPYITGYIAAVLLFINHVYKV